MDSVVETALSMLGLQAEDKVTGFKGMVSSVCFDAYGCVQAVVSPLAGNDGKLGDSHLFDIKRLEILKKRIIEAPDFLEIKPGKEIGPAMTQSVVPQSRL